jgi:hypothetical protein
MKALDDELDEPRRDDGVTAEACDDEPLLARLAVEKLKLGAYSKTLLDAAISAAAKGGWRVAVRSHCSESGRHAAKLFRPLPRPAAAAAKTAPKQPAAAPERSRSELPGRR